MNKNKTVYSFGVIIANLKLEPFDDNAKNAIESVYTIMNELDIYTYDTAILIGYANTKHISINEAVKEFEKIIEKMENFN